MLQTTTADGIKPAKEIWALAFSTASDIERNTQFGNLLRDARWLAWRKRGGCVERTLRKAMV